MQQQASKPKGGFPTWLIVLLAVIGGVVVLGGTLIALAFSGMQRYLAASKTAEAKTTVSAISRSAVAAYERDQGGSALVEAQEPASSQRLCDTASPVPATLAAVKGTKYMPSSAPGADFEAGTATAGWKCLRFSVGTPIRYQYRYTRGSGYLVPSLATGVNGFEASAQGDIDADGMPSTFALTGVVGPNDTVVVSPSIYTENELE